MDSVVPGALAAFVVDCSIFPLDTLKTRYQATDYATRFPNGRGLTKGLWQGFGPVVIATLPSAAIFFSVYESAKVAYTSPSLPLIGSYTSTESGSHFAHSAASVSAELAACLVLAPAETIKQRRQVQVPGASRSSSSRSTHNALSTTLRATVSTLTEPAQLRNLWKGYLALAGRNIPQTAIQFPIWERVRSVLSERAGVDVRSRRDERGGAASSLFGGKQAPLTAGHYGRVWLVSGGSAAIAGAIASFFTTPLDVVKTRIMLGGPGAGKAGQGAVSLLGTILREEGVHALWRGGAMRCAWTALGASIYFGSYDAGREWWRESGKHEAHAAKEELAKKGERIKETVTRS